MKKVDNDKFEVESEKDIDTNIKEKSLELNNSDKGYFEFLQEAKSRQRNIDENTNRILWDDSDYNAIFMTF